MNKNLLATILFLPIALLALWIFYVDAQSREGSDIKVSIMGYDPRDILSGHYILYQIDWEKTDCSQFPDNVCHEETFCTETKWRGRSCRFYVPEDSAKQLNELFFKRNDNNTKFEVIYSYNPSRKAIAKQLLINGKDWKEMIKD